jgi:DnaJ-class molecular chaperone
MKYEKCPHCEGSGLVLNTYNGEPDRCGYCKGNTVVPKRDEKGRFVK